MLPEIGALVGGKYKIERRVGEGGMAVVYEVSTTDGQRLAMTVLKPDYAKSADVVSRFNREGRAVRKLKSPHAAQVVDVAVTAEGLPFMTMEFLSGRELSEELLKRGPLPIDEAVGYIIQACVAIREAHHRRIVHRDLKPDKLFLVRVDDDTIIKVLDFGISKIQDEVGEMTNAAAVMGTPYYMSPEQVRSTKSADSRSDLWSLGVILYELLTRSSQSDRCPTSSAGRRRRLEGARGACTRGRSDRRVRMARSKGRHAFLGERRHDRPLRERKAHRFREGHPRFERSRVSRIRRSDERHRVVDRRQWRTERRFAVVASIHGADRRRVARPQRLGTRPSR